MNIRYTSQYNDFNAVDAAGLKLCPRVMSIQADLPCVLSDGGVRLANTVVKLNLRLG